MINLQNHQFVVEYHDSFVYYRQAWISAVTQMSVLFHVIYKVILISIGLQDMISQSIKQNHFPQKPLI